MLHPTTDRAWAEVSLDCIAYNYQAMCEYLQSGCQLIAVLKADGYGHGAVQVGRLFQDAFYLAGPYRCAGAYVCLCAGHETGISDAASGGRLCGCGMECDDMGVFCL